MAFVGDFGSGDEHAKEISEMVAKSQPDAVVSLGDNVYSDRGYERLVGQLYGEFIKTGRFFPAPGNHDYDFGINNYDSYFGLSDGPRFYSRTFTDVKLCVLDSTDFLANFSSKKLQLEFLQNDCAVHPSEFAIGVMHHSPFSSGSGHGSNQEMQLDFKSLGIDVVMSGHDHIYERLEKNDISFIVNGMGGMLPHSCGVREIGSKFCQAREFGAYFVEVEGNQVRGYFKTVDGLELDKTELS